MLLMISASLTPIRLAELAYSEYSLYNDVEKIPLSSVLILATMPFLTNWWRVCSSYLSIGPITTLDEGLVSIIIFFFRISRCMHAVSYTHLTLPTSDLV